MSTGGGFSYFGADFNSNLSGTFSAGISVLPVDAHGVVTFGKIIVSW